MASKKKELNKVKAIFFQKLKNIAAYKTGIGRDHKS
jgi:hypothetical protein